jgi:hypothetical protein
MPRNLSTVQFSNSANASPGLQAAPTAICATSQAVGDSESTGTTPSFNKVEEEGCVSIFDSRDHDHHSMEPWTAILLTPRKLCISVTTSSCCTCVRARFPDRLSHALNNPKQLGLACFRSHTILYRVRCTSVRSCANAGKRLVLIRDSVRST